MSVAIVDNQQHHELFQVTVHKYQLLKVITELSSLAGTFHKKGPSAISIYRWIDVAKGGLIAQIAPVINVNHFKQYNPFRILYINTVCPYSSMCLSTVAPNSINTVHQQQQNIWRMEPPLNIYMEYLSIYLKWFGQPTPHRVASDCAADI